MSELLTAYELNAIRADVDQIFEDVGMVERVTSKGVLDHDTAEFAGEVRALVYEGPCLVTPIISRRDRFDEVGQGLIFTRQYRVDLPWDEDEVQIRDVFTITASDDPQVVGREMQVRDVLVGTNLGYRRLTVQDVRE
jgi:hypothetical protein